MCTARSMFHVRSCLLMSPALLLFGCPPPAMPAGTQSDDTAASGSDDGSDGGAVGDTGAESTEEAPSIAILFPETRKDVVICPTFVMVVDIDGLDLVPFGDGVEHVEGQGHWHLYDSGDYVGAYSDTWGLVELEHQGSAARPHILTATLAQNDHGAMGIEATVEIMVGTEGCIGGDPDAAGDTGAR